MLPKPFQVRYLLPRKNRHDNLPRVFPNLAIRNKNSLSNPACIGLLPDTFNAEVLELRCIDSLDILYVRGVDYGLTEDVGFKCLSVAVKEGLKRVPIVAFSFGRHSLSVQV